MVDETLKTLVDFVMSASSTDMPSEALDKSRDIIVDTLGCAIGGRDTIAAAASKAYPARPTGNGAGVVIGSPGEYPVEIAAFWNSAMIRYLDINDTYPPISHPSDLIGALVAASKTVGASGMDLIRANLVAYEIFARLSETVLGRDARTLDYGYGVCVSATAGLCHLLKLSKEQTTQAIAMAATSGIQLRANRAGQLSDYKGTQTAVSSRDAVFFTFLAQQGLTGPSAPFDGRHGIMELLDGKASPVGIDGFGTWKIFRTCLKYWPSTYNTQASIWAALELRKKVNWENIDNITLYTSKFLHHESGSEPEKWDPTTRQTADHSLPYVFSRAMQHGTVDQLAYEPEAIADRVVRKLMNKITVVVDNEIDAQWPKRIGIRLKATDNQGAVHEVEVFDPVGHEFNPMKKPEIERKFASLTTSYLGDQSARAFDLAWRMGELPKFEVVLNAFVPGGEG